MTWCWLIGHRWVWLRSGVITNDDFYSCSRCLNHQRVSFHRLGYEVVPMKKVGD